MGIGNRLISPRLIDSTATNQNTVIRPSSATCDDTCAMRIGPPSSSAPRVPAMIWPNALSVAALIATVSSAANHTAINGSWRTNTAAPLLMTPIRPIRNSFPNRSVISTSRGVTKSSTSTPSRSTTNRSGTPAFSLTICCRVMNRSMVVPSMLTMVSPGCIPAASAALPGWISLISAGVTRWPTVTNMPARTTTASTKLASGPPNTIAVR